MTSAGDAAARVRAAASASRQVLGRAPSGLFADIDGTLSRIPAHPNEATVTAPIRRALECLGGSLDIVMAVTGRGAKNARDVVGTDAIEYVGNHGLERRRDGAVSFHPLGLPFVERIATLVRTLENQPPDVGLVIEDKGPSASIHYRLAPDPDLARTRLLNTLAPLLRAADLRVVEGTMVINLLPRVAVNKGTAIEGAIAEHGLRGAVFLGDDITDVDALRALRRLREHGDITTLGIGVMGPESPPEVAEAADLVVHGVEEVERLLVALADIPPGRAGL